MADLVTYKESLEAEMSAQEAALHTRLSDAKRKRMEALVRENKIISYYIWINNSAS